MPTTVGRIRTDEGHTGGGSAIDIGDIILTTSGRIEIGDAADECPHGSRCDTGTGTYADTDEVPDASRITPPYVGRGQRTGNDIFAPLR